MAGLMRPRPFLEVCEDSRQQPVPSMRPGFHPLVLSHHGKPTGEISGTFFAHLRGDLQVAAQEARGHLGNQFLEMVGGRALIRSFQPVEAVGRPCPVGLMPISA